MVDHDTQGQIMGEVMETTAHPHHDFS